MKKIVILLFTCFAFSLHAQITDSSLVAWYQAHPEIREILQNERPDLFQKIVLDSTLINYWKEYHIGGDVQAERYYMVQKIGADFKTIVELGPMGDCFTIVNIKGNDVVFISPYIRNGILPAHDLKIVEKLNE